MTGSDVLLVGSLPYETAEDAFRAAGSALDGHVGWLPDGEPGPRQMWVGMLLALVFSQHPDIEETKAPPAHAIPETSRRTAASAQSQGPGEELEGMWLFRVKPGRNIRFDDLKYGSFAMESYGVFRRLRDEGAIPPGVRFQMSLPSPHSSIDGCFEDPDQWPDLYAAYIQGIRGEIRKALETIPADDLVIQWDVALEFLDLFLGEKNWLRFWPKLTAGGEVRAPRRAARRAVAGHPGRDPARRPLVLRDLGRMADGGPARPRPLRPHVQRGQAAVSAGGSTTCTCQWCASPMRRSSRRSTDSTSATRRCSSAWSTTPTPSRTSAAGAISRAST